MNNKKVPLCVYLDGYIERRQVKPADGGVTDAITPNKLTL